MVLRQNKYEKLNETENYPGIDPKPIVQGYYSVASWYSPNRVDRDGKLNIFM